MKLFIFLLTLIAAFYVTAIYPAIASADEGTRQKLIKLSKQVAREDSRQEVLRAYRARVERVRTILAGANSPMVEEAESFVACGEQYGVDYRLLLGIAHNESNFGLAGYARGSRNAFGWGVHQGVTFATWGDGVCRVAKGLAGPLYAGKSIEEIIHIYAPESDGNDPKSYSMRLNKFIKNV